MSPVRLRRTLLVSLLLALLVLTAAACSQSSTGDSAAEASGGSGGGTGGGTGGGSGSGSGDVCTSSSALISSNTPTPIPAMASQSAVEFNPLNYRMRARRRVHPARQRLAPLAATAALIGLTPDQDVVATLCDFTGYAPPAGILDAVETAERTHLLSDYNPALGPAAG